MKWLSSTLAAVNRRHGDNKSIVNDEKPAPAPSKFPSHTTSEKNETDRRYNDFLATYPNYSPTSVVENLRSRSFNRLGAEVYVDYMGGCLMPEELVRWHSEFLLTQVMGNTHSVSQSSRTSAFHASEARRTTLDYFDAPSEEYTVVFTSSATHALKLVGESFPFTSSSNLILPADAHNSAHGIREFAGRAGSEVCYLECLREGGFDIPDAKREMQSRSTPPSTPSLFVFTGQSNITNTLTPLSIAAYASSLHYYTLLDAAALAPTTRISLRKNPGVDAMAISFYKMFGYPTGVGALVVKKSFLEVLGRTRPWFAGGSVDVVQVPGGVFTRAREIHEQFEDGTINYLSLPAIPKGLELLESAMSVLPKRLRALSQWLIRGLSALKYSNGKPCVSILSRVHENNRDNHDELGAGYTIALLFHGSNGDVIPLSYISHIAFKHNISLRTGCMCNAGGAAAMLGITSYMSDLRSGDTLEELERRVGKELGVVRISLGLASNWGDVERVVDLGKWMKDERARDSV